MPLSPEEQVIIDLCKSPKKSRSILDRLQKQAALSAGLDALGNDRLISAYKNLIKSGRIVPDEKVAKALRLKEVRSLSGIVVVSVLTKPYPCPGACLYCPTVNDLPKSYVADEPAVMRAQQNNFDPYRQTYNRLLALSRTGHPHSKISLRIIGGTWSYYHKTYRTWFIKRCFQACNDFGSGKKSHHSQNLSEAQITNETAACRLVEISVETRQDFIDPAEILHLRRLGVTKVELGVQSVYDDVLQLNRRGHNVSATIDATRRLKDAGFKVSYQVMLNLPGSDKQRDLAMFDELFSNQAFQPDQLKIYPLALVESAEVYKLYRERKFKPYTKQELIDLLCAIKPKIPPYVRIERVIRDISAAQIVAGGAKVSNLRQLVTQQMASKGEFCRCIRCREIRSRRHGRTRLVRRDYKASGGHEIFLSIEDPHSNNLYSLLRMRIPSGKTLLPELEDAAIIREIHTYGTLVEVGESSDNSAQHKGFGRSLLAEAERIAKKEFHRKKVAVISGVGVRPYFRKLGYQLEGTYMTKIL